MEIIINSNQEATIFPSSKGWNLIKTNLVNHIFSHNVIGITDTMKKVDEYIAKRRTDDGGYRDTIWEIIETHNNLFYHGSSDLENTKMIIHE